MLTGATESDVHLFVADVIKSFDTVDRALLERVLSSLGLTACHAYFEYHAHVGLRFLVAAGFGEPWTCDGRDSSGVPFEHDVYCCFVPSLV